MKTDSPVKILMVDDRAENLFALEVILSGQNYLCVKAGSGNEALKILLHQQDFAIILLDVQMPGMDGFETAELIREIEKLKHVPIIFLTASMDSPVHIFNGYKAGAVDYMIKPFSPEILKAKVAVFIDLYKKTHELLAQADQMKTLNSDVTAQKRIEENLKKSLKEISDYKYALDESSIVAITDQEGIIKYANDNFCKISKYSRKELIGQNHRIINSGYHPKEFIRDLWAVIASGKIWKGEMKNKAKDGTIYWVNSTIIPFLNEHGKPYQYMAIRTDITEQKRIESELTRAKIFAEQAAGIADEAKSKAESAAQIAEDAVKAKQQFLSNMSHEIRTPMNAIIGFTKVLLKTNLNKKQEEYLNAIKVSGDTLIVLINDILDLAKVDAGKMTFEHAPFKLTVSISAMLHLFETKIQEKNLELIKEYDNSIPEVLIGDSVRLHQIILNLVSNAVKFTTKGKITVSVLLLKEDEDKAVIEFTVTDTGIGIAENKIEKIFENFQQAANDTSRLYGGTGLGLAIAKQLVERQGGSIRVKSKIDEGAAFSFILSFKKTKAEAPSEEEIIKLDASIKNLKVLVVEDIALNRLLVKTLLDDFGFESDYAANGKIAVEKIKAAAYDIILMDLQMPVMNGFETAEYIRSTMNSKIPIIALTADVTTADLAKCKAVGMNDYIAKPIDEKLLYSKIAGLVKKKQDV